MPSRCKLSALAAGADQTASRLAAAATIPLGRADGSPAAILLRPPFMPSLRFFLSPMWLYRGAPIAFGNFSSGA